MTVRALVVPYDSGRCRERMGRGPDHLLERAIRPLLARLGHGLEAEEIALDDPHPAEIRAAFRLNAAVSERMSAALRDGCFPLVLSGNCNIAVGAMSGCSVARTRLV